MPYFLALSGHFIVIDRQLAVTKVRILVVIVELLILKANQNCNAMIMLHSNQDNNILLQLLCYSSFKPLERHKSHESLIVSTTAVNKALRQTSIDAPFLCRWAHRNRNTIPAFLSCHQLLGCYCSWDFFL